MTDAEIVAYLQEKGIAAEPEQKPALATPLVMADLTLATHADEVKVPCEVYSRIVGYLRPVQNWNVAKQGEFAERVVFNVGAMLDDADVS